MCSFSYLGFTLQNISFHVKYFLMSFLQEIQIMQHMTYIAIHTILLFFPLYSRTAANMIFIHLIVQLLYIFITLAFCNRYLKLLTAFFFEKQTVR